MGYWRNQKGNQKILEKTTMKTQLKTYEMQQKQAVLRGKFIAIQSHLKKQEKHWIDDLTLHLNNWKKKKKLVEGNKS